MRSRSWWWADSGLAKTDIEFFTHLDGQLQLLATHELRPLNRHNSGLDAELFEGSFQFLDQGFFNLSLRIHDPADQPFTQSADALTDQVS